ncbi:MAG: T9SS type A sorting domain-containing protein [Flavobacteriia bacterium]|nr:T9SS type A sorting domain-containing protein [Flavobacteriia bacterium]
MKTFLPLFIFCTVLANAQTEVKWKKVFGGSQGDSFSKQVKTTDSNFVFSGSTSSSDGDLPVNYGSNDVVVSKITKDGNILWTKVIGGNDYDAPQDMIKTSDGGVILTVLSSSNTDFFPQHYGNESSYDVYVIKLDKDGNILWSKFIGGSGEESKASVVSTNSGYVVAINSISNDFDFESLYGGKNILVIKFDEAGNIIWRKNLAGSNDEVFEDLRSFDQENVLLAINSDSTDGSFSNSTTTIKKGFVVKINSEGDVVFSTPIITDNPNLVNSVSTINSFNNQYFAVGTERKESFQAVGIIKHFDAMLVNFSESGSLLWKKNYSWKVSTSNNSETYYDGALFIEQTIDNHILLSGVTYIHEDSMYGINLISSWLKKIDMQGNLVNTIGRISRTYKLEKLPNGLFIDHAYKYEYGPYGVTSIYDLQIVTPDGMNFLPSSSFKSVLTTDKHLGTRTSTSTVDGNNLILFSNRNNLIESSIWITRIQSSEFTTTELASEEVEATKVDIYPNPTSNFIKLSRKANIISLYDTSGKMLITAKDTDVIDLTKFLKGVYFLKVQIDDKTKSFKVIKN